MNIVGKTSGKMVSFSCDAPHAQAVYLIGDFNAWNHTSDPMRRQGYGSWSLELLLGQGRHYYQFLVDGAAVLDPHALCLTLEERHEKVSFIALG
jgi:1,4-alpha-glucan branching enzyme